MVQRHHLPLVVEDRGTGRARVGVGAVVQEQLQLIDNLVVADRQLFRLTVGVLDDVHLLPHQQLAAVLDQGKPAVGVQVTVVDHGHEAVIQFPIGQEELLWRQGEALGGLQLATGLLLEIELHLGLAGLFGIGQHMVVGEQQPGGNQEAGTEALAGASPTADMNPPHGLGNPQTLLEEAKPNQVIGVEHPLQGPRKCPRGSPGALGIKMQPLPSQAVHPLRIGKQSAQALTDQVGGINSDAEDVAGIDLSDIAFPLRGPLSVALFGIGDRTKNGHR